MTDWLHQHLINRPDFPAALGLGPGYKAWRIKRLAEIVTWAAEKSPHYRRVLTASTLADFFRIIKAAPSDIHGAQKALALLPFTAPAELAADSDDFLAVGHSEVDGIVSVPTSGTSGQAKRIFSTAEDMEETIGFFQYGMRILVGPGDRVALAMSPARRGNVADLLGRALSRWGLPFLAPGFVPGRAEEIEAWLKKLIAWRPSCLVGVPPQMLALGRHEMAGPLKAGLKTMLLSGDAADDDLVRELEKLFGGARVYRHYGLTECGLGGAVECRERAWPHLRDDLWAEIIDENGRALEPGRPGEICLTPLNRRGQPLLRYRTGDEGLIVPGDCACGSVFPRLKTIGRLSDRLRLSSGRIIRPADLDSPLSSLSFIRDYAVSWRGKSKELTIDLALAPAEPPEAEKIAAQALRAWLGADGAEVKLSVTSAGTERPAAQGGKRRLERIDE